MKSSRTKNSILNILTGIGSQLLTIILGFLNRSVFLYCLSVEYLGIQGLFSDVLSMLSLADLGFSTAMTFSLYKPLAENNTKKISGLINFYKKVYGYIALAITILGISLIPFLGYIINLESEMPNLTLYYILYLANTVSSYLFVYKTSILDADQKTHIVTTINIAFSIIQTLFGIVLLLITHNYTAYLLSLVIFTYAKNFYASHFAQKKYPYIKSKVKLSKKDTKNIFSNIKSVFLYKLSGVMINATDNTLISILIGTAVVGYYSNYTLIVTKISGVVNTFFYSLTASLGNLVVTSDSAKRRNMFNIMQTTSIFLSTFCIACVLLLVQDFISLWLGSNYLLSNSVLYALVTNFYLSIVLLPIWVFRDATGLYNKTKYVMLITAFINIVISIILGKTIGLSGIIIATSISRLLTYFWYEPILLFKTYFGTSSKYYFIGILKSFLVTIFSITIAYFLTKSIDVTNYILLIVKFLVISFSTLIILVIFYYKDSGFIYLKKKITNIIKDRNCK